MQVMIILGKYISEQQNNTDTAHLNEKGHERFLKVAESFILQY